MDELFASPSGSTRDDLHTQENEETPENPTTSPTTVNQGTMKLSLKIDSSIIYVVELAKLPNLSELFI